MEKLKKMTWPNVILLALITAIYTGIVMCFDVLDNTSIQDIGVAFECWFVFAIFIVVNCKKPVEAALKCFVFFLISQPLIYLIQVPFNPLGFGIFMYYKHWFILTLLTLPGGAIAWLLTKKNWLSALILCVPQAYMAEMAVCYGIMAKNHFPHHIVSAIFCLALAILFPAKLLDERKHKIFCWTVAAVVLVAALFVPSLRLL